MRFFNKLSIKYKLVCVIVSIAVATFVSGFIVQTIYQHINFKNTLTSFMVTSAKLIGDYSVAPLIFEDKQRAELNLQQLGKISSIEIGRVFDNEGRLFASYKRKRNKKIPSIKFRNEYQAFNNGYLHLFQPIEYGGVKYGTVYLIISTDLLWKEISKNLVIMGIITFWLFLLSYLLAVHFQKVITKPLLNLTGTMKEVSLKQDYAVRLKKASEDEIGLLYVGFNDMLEQISIREKERDDAAAEIHHLRNYLSNIIDSMPSVIIGVDENCKVTQWNRQAEIETIIKAEDAGGKILYDIFPKLIDETGNITTAMKDSVIKSNPKKLSQNNGDVFYEDITIYPLLDHGAKGAVIRIDDVTDRVAMEEMMIQSEKMLSLGGLAAGMAHEINNPLAGMVQNALVILNRINNDIPANNKAAEECGTNMISINMFLKKRNILTQLELIHQSGMRASKVVQNMLSFATKSNSKPIPIDICELINSTLELAKSDYDMKKKYDFRQIEIVRLYKKGLPKVCCEESKIQQVILNLLRNGAEAMAEEKILNAKNYLELKQPTFYIRVMCEQNWIRIEIEDNGPGMCPKVSKRIFEPFFTTKETGKGTGLGLSVSYFIITENHKGTMTVESTLGKGTLFIIRLPLVGAK